MVIYQLEIQLDKCYMFKLEVKRNNKIQTVQTSGCFKSIHMCIFEMQKNREVAMINC